MPKSLPTHLANKAAIARALGITRQRLTYHTHQPEFPKPDDARRYRTAEVLAYGRAAGLIVERGVHRASADTTRKERGFLDLNQERARLAKEQADAKAIENDEARKRLLDATAVAAAWTVICANVRQRVLSLPTKVESQCNLPPEQRARLRTILDAEVDDLLSELAKPPDYQILDNENGKGADE